MQETDARFLEPRQPRNGVDQIRGAIARLDHPVSVHRVQAVAQDAGAALCQKRIHRIVPAVGCRRRVEQRMQRFCCHQAVVWFLSAHTHGGSHKKPGTRRVVLPCTSATQTSPARTHKFAARSGSTGPRQHLLALERREQLLHRGVARRAPRVCRAQLLHCMSPCADPPQKKGTWLDLALAGEADPVSGTEERWRR